MCSIFGVGFYKDHGFKDKSTLIGVISRIFKLAECAGKEAAGLSIMREQSVDILRRPLSGSKLVSTTEYMDFMDSSLENMCGSNKLMSIIGHCRYPTQGSASNNENNHPQVVGNIIGIHNGTITNNHDLFESFGKVIERQAEVDTEIIFQLIHHFGKAPMSKTIDSIKKATPYLGGSYACGMQNAHHPYNLYLFRHSNPIKILNYPELGVIFFATREYFITEGFEEFTDNEDKGEVIELVQDQGMVFNLWNHTFCKFMFQDRQHAQELRNA